MRSFAGSASGTSSTCTREIGWVASGRGSRCAPASCETVVGARLGVLLGFGSLRRFEQSAFDGGDRGGMSTDGGRWGPGLANGLQELGIRQFGRAIVLVVLRRPVLRLELGFLGVALGLGLLLLGPLLRVGAVLPCFPLGAHFLLRGRRPGGLPLFGVATLRRLCVSTDLALFLARCRLGRGNVVGMGLIGLDPRSGRCRGRSGGEHLSIWSVVLGSGGVLSGSASLGFLLASLAGGLLRLLLLLAFGGLGLFLLLASGLLWASSRSRRAAALASLRWRRAAALASLRSCRSGLAVGSSTGGTSACLRAVSTMDATVLCTTAGSSNAGRSGWVVASV